jgi:hypothetical protein
MSLVNRVLETTYEFELASERDRIKRLGELGSRAPW